MRKQEVLQRIKDCGVVAVVRAESDAQAKSIAEACVEAGIVGIEITFTVPGALSIITALKEQYKNGEVLVGAGTVLDAHTVRNAILAGADFVVSPALNKELVALCNRYQVAVMPGALTPKEVIEAMEAGADIVKIVPANLYGPKIIKALKGPLPQCELMPTGGVSVENTAEWIKAGAAAVGAGSELTAGAKTGDYESITRLGKQMVREVAKARQVL